MAKETILFADNDADFLKTRTDFLEQEGYRVIPAAGPAETRRQLERGGIDLAILDIRLRDDDDEKDTSGLTLAKEVARSVPKIMLTNFPSVDAARSALRPQLNGLPAALEFVSKVEGPEVFIQAVHRALEFGSEWLRKFQETVSEIDRELKEDYDNAQRQSNANYWASLVVAMIGIVIIFLGIALVLLKQIEIGVASTVGGLVTEVVSYLFFKRVDAANERMDRYHKERFEGKRFGTLLQACDGLDLKRQREHCREQVIMAAIRRWLKVSEGGKASLITKAVEDLEGSGE